MQLTPAQRRVAIAAAAVIAAVIAAVAYFGARREGGESASTVVRDPAQGAVRTASVTGLNASAPARVASAPMARDLVGHATNLRALHDRYRQSADPAERRVALRAFSACVPAFLPSMGQSPSPEPMIRALPAAQRSEREAAWREIFSRCEGFAGEARDALLDSNTAWRRDKDAAEPGARAVSAARAGRLADAQALVGAIAVDDPAAIDSLGGIGVALARRRDPDNRELAQRAEAVDTALPLVACDLGMACDAQSLRALQLCAVEGMCSGDVAARVLSRPGIDPGLAEMAQRERERIVQRIRANGQATLADLLP